MTKDDIKGMVREIIEARIYNPQFGTEFRTSTEYTLTPEEQASLKNMTANQRQKFASMKLKQARRNRGVCISCGQPVSPKPDGTPSIYCDKHLAQFRASRGRLAQKRGSCTRCPNPPLPGQKLCKKCTDELVSRRKNALKAGTCIRCFEKPAEKGMQICADCAKEKRDTEKLRRATYTPAEVERNRKRDANYVAKQKALKIGYEIEEGLKEIAFNKQPKYPPQFQKVVDIIIGACKVEGENPEHWINIKHISNQKTNSWSVQNPPYSFSLVYYPEKDAWVAFSKGQSHLLRKGSELFYAKKWMTGF